MTMLSEVQPSYAIALKLWWAMLWRGFPLAIVSIVIGAFAMGIIIAIIGTAMGMDKEQIKGMSGIAGGLLGLFLGLGINLWVLRRLMTKGFGRFRLAVLEK